MNADRVESVPFVFTRRPPRTDTDPEGIQWELSRSTPPSIAFLIHDERDEHFMRGVLQAVTERDAKEMMHFVYLDPAHPTDRAAFVADLCAVVETDFAQELEKAFACYGFFDWNPATKRFDRRINPKTGEPINA